jgi:hypothetical protein
MTNGKAWKIERYRYNERKTVNEWGQHGSVFVDRKEALDELERLQYQESLEAGPWEEVKDAEPK